LLIKKFGEVLTSLTGRKTKSQSGALVMRQRIPDIIMEAKFMKIMRFNYTIILLFAEKVYEKCISNSLL